MWHAPLTCRLRLVWASPGPACLSLQLPGAKWNPFILWVTRGEGAAPVQGQDGHSMEDWQDLHPPLLHQHPPGPQHQPPGPGVWVFLSCLIAGLSLAHYAGTEDSECTDVEVRASIFGLWIDLGMRIAVVSTKHIGNLLNQNKNNYTTNLSLVPTATIQHNFCHNFAYVSVPFIWGRNYAG